MNKLLPVFIAAAFTTVSMAATAADAVQPEAKKGAEVKHETAKKPHATAVKSKKEAKKTKEAAAKN